MSPSRDVDADSDSAPDSSPAPDSHAAPDGDAAPDSSPAPDSEPDSEREPEPIDQLGIPMRREPTLDDVRSDGRDHRQLAFGCSVLVSLLVVAFWLVRGMLLAE